MNLRSIKISPRHQFVVALLIAITASLALYGYGALQGYGLRFEYLIWNSFLAILPLVFALLLVAALRTKRWSDWGPMGWTLAWLLFLPNSFYMITDFIHLREVGANNILYAVVLFTSFIYLGVFLGFCSLCLIHNELRRRISPLAAWGCISGVLFSCSFAIYLGRDLRWNSWDVLINPFGLLFDISDRLLRPEAFPEMFVIVLSFFVLLSSLYAVVWKAARALRQANS